MMARSRRRRFRAKTAIWQTLSFGSCLIGVGMTGLLVLTAGRADDRIRSGNPGRSFSGSSVATRETVHQNGADSGPDASEWKADVPEIPWNFIVIHHSATSSGSVQSIHEEHRRRTDAGGNPWLGIGYHFVIGNGQGMEDGQVEATFRWREQLHGAHSGNVMFNARGIGVCLIGDFEKHRPTKKQWDSVRRLVTALAGRHGIDGAGIVGHASVKPTACPGRYFPLQSLKDAVVFGG